MASTCRRWLSLIPFVLLLALSPQAWAGAGGMGYTGEDSCTTIDGAYLDDMFFNILAPIEAAKAVDPSLPDPPCDTGSWPIVKTLAGAPILDANGYDILDVPTDLCEAFDILVATSCVLTALVPEPGRFPLIMLVVGAGGIIVYRTRKRRAHTLAR